MKESNYFLDKNKKTGELLYLEYDKIEGYNIKPKRNIENAIRVNKIVFVNPSLSEKLIRKKIDIKIKYLLKKLQDIDESGDTEEGIKNTLMDAEKLRVTIINNYVKFLGNTYKSLTLKKIEVIINELRIKLFNNINNKKRVAPTNLFYLDNEEYKEEKRGRGR